MTEIQQRILKEEYPTMSYDSDSDIERYFEMRRSGRQADSLALYNNRLRKKYPNDRQRADLMRYYRSRDPRYSEILRESMIDLAERLVTRTTYVISLLTRDINAVDMTDAYSVIKLAEGLLSVISPDRYVAIAFTEKYVRYAKALSYRHAEMERTAELIRLYVTDTIESVQDLKKEREERRKQRLRQVQHSKRNQHANFDLSRIVFSPEDIYRIQIPAEITRTEDIVIAYCLKYWNLVRDAAFEKTVFLYSRKYHTKHSDIFLAIQNGVTHGWKDEEILNAVLATVITGYYYSISGDVYLQRTWARYKGSLLNSGTVANAEMPVALPEQIALAPSPGKQAVKARKIKPHAKASKPKTGAIRVKTTKSLAVSPASTKKPKPVTPFKAQKTAPKRRRPPLPQKPSIAPNSVSDMIKKLTGKTYTVYQELFFRSIRPSIRDVLASSSARRGQLFGGRQNNAEEIIYAFLNEHYDNPYLNWKESEERKAVEALGYRMPDLEPVIAQWVKKNG